MTLNLLLLAAGFALLIKAADYLVEGASDIARRFRVSSLVIGLTVVAFGTSAPELAVNILSAVSGNTDIAIGNINGSNIANILLVLGITALFVRIPVQSRTVIKEIPYMMLAGVMLLFLMSDVVLDGAAANAVTRIDGLVLISFFIIFLYYLFLTGHDAQQGKKEKAKHKLPLAILWTIMGLVGLVLGGQLAVQGASGFALGLGISQTLVALTVVAVGTSLPELVTAVVAARKGETDLAVGNVVGSVIFNILFVLGTTAVITPLAIESVHVADGAFALASMLLLLLVVQFGNGFFKDPNKDVSRREGVVMLAFYAAYTVYIIMRG